MIAMAIHSCIDCQVLLPSCVCKSGCKSPFVPMLKRGPHNAWRTDNSYPVCSGFKPRIFMASCMVCVPVLGGPTSKSLNASTARVQRSHDTSLKLATPMAGTPEFKDKSRGFGLCFESCKHGHFWRVCVRVLSIYIYIVNNYINILYS